MAKFRIATPAGASFSVAGGGYGYELEALTPIDAEIYEIPAGSEEEFVAHLAMLKTISEPLWLAEV